MLGIIKIGSIGDVVKVAQYLTGFSTRKEASGEFNSVFEEYIKKWQTDNGLVNDGIIGTNTWSAICKKAPTCSTSKNKTSEATCAVQILVGGLDVDGIYGTKTKKAVAAYQSAAGLSADGICGQKTWNSLICKSDKPDDPSKPDVPGKVINKCVHYLQWDKKWKNIKYSTHTSAQTIGNSGCGPSAMAQIMATFIDPNITPVEMCKLSVDNGFRTYDSGTKWGFFEFVFKKYPKFSKFVATASVEALKEGLAQGALAVCSMNGNDNHFWTSQGL